MTGGPKNEEELNARGMHFDRHACVTTSRGKRSMFEEGYEEYKCVVQDLIGEHCTGAASL